jgi:hypothetical protein
MCSFLKKNFLLSFFFLEERQRTTKLDTGGVREERFEGLVYHQGASIR